MTEISDVEIRALGPEDADVYQRFRLAALREAPEAFGSTYEEDAVLAPGVVAERLRAAREPAGRVVLGAFAGGALVGVAGCMQEPKLKARHKAMVWGMYVQPDRRGQGLGRQLLSALVAEARAWPDVERLTLTVVERGEAARRLYAGAGFEPFGHEPDGLRQDEARDTVIYMGLALERWGARGPAA